MKYSNKELLVKVKSIYGIDKVYPECEEGQLLAQLTGKKTFTNDNLGLLKKLGYTFKVSPISI